MRSPDSPTLAEHFAGLKSDYAAARPSRFRRRRTGLAPLGSGADYHYRTEADYLRVMEYARDMDRNDVIVGQLIDRATDNCLQDGFVLDPNTGDRGLDADLAARWGAWSADPEQCDLAGEHPWADLERFALRQTMVDGDIFLLPNVSGALEAVEAHRCRTPSNTQQNVVLGIKLDPTTRRRLEYWFTLEDTNPLAAVTRVADVRRYAARDVDGFRQVFHVRTGKRVSQTRGVSALAPVFDVCGMFEDINFAVLLQRQVVSCFAVFRERELGFEGIAPAGADPKGPRTTEPGEAGFSRLLEGIGPAMEIAGIPGEKLKMDSPNVPNPEYFPHMRLILTLIGINLGLPLVMVLMDASETNFSGWRGAIDQAKIGFRRLQRRLRDQFHVPVYRWKIRQWLAADAALARAAGRSGINLFGHTWHAPTWPYIQPLQDAQADLLMLRNALTSRRRRAAARGMDREQLDREIVEDNAALIVAAHAKAQEVNAQNPGLAITWRDLACLPTPDGVTIASQPGFEPNPPAAKPQDGDAA